MRNNTKNRFISGLLAGIIMLNQVPVFVAAEETGLCEHHTLHEDCGYVEGISGSQCTHEHTDCYVLEEDCVHDHVDCGYSEIPEENLCDHQCTQDSGCITEQFICTHEYDDGCGYREEVVAQDCDYECQWCVEQRTVCTTTLDCTSENHLDFCEKKLESEKRVVQKNTDEFIAQGNCGENATWILDAAGILVISGTGEIQRDENMSVYSDVILEVIILDGITEIADSAFDGFSSMTSISLPNNLSMINPCTFMNCSSLKNISIPETVTSIGASAFYGCSSLENIILPDTLLNIGHSAFFECVSLTNISVPVGITSIKESTFYGCTNLKEVYIPNSINEIGSNAFANCNHLDNVVLPEGIKIIADNVFNGCSNISSIVIPESVTNIESYAFFNCTSLLSISFSKNIKSIGWSAFEGCSSLKSITFAGNAPSMDSAFTDVIATAYYPGYDKTWTANIMNASGKSITWEANNQITGTCGANLSWTIDYVSGIMVISGTGEMDNYDVYDTTSPTYYSQPWANFENSITRVVVSEGVTTVGRRAFYNFDKIENVELPNSLISIGDYAFYQCNGLQKISIPKNVDALYGWPFYSCKNLKEVTFEGNAPEMSNAFANVTADVYYAADDPSWTETARQNAGGNLTWIPVSGYCGDSLLWSYDRSAGVLAISGNGDMYDYDYMGSAPYVTTPWNAYLAEIRDLQLCNGITSIGNYAFYKCDGLEEVTIPDSVTEIGESIFEECDNLSSITVGNGVTEISTCAFQWCRNLENVILGNSVTRIGIRAFWNCNNLVNVNIPSSVTVIDREAFTACTNLEKISFPSNITEIGERAFQECSGLTSLEIPSSVTSIGSLAFSGCNNLSSITFLGDAPSIGTSAFNGDIATCYYDGNLSSWNTVIENTYSGTITWVPYGIEEHIHKFGDDNLCECGMYGGTCGENLTWLLDAEGILTIFGTGAMSNYSFSEIPWSGQRDLVKKIVLEHGVASIGDNAFADCGNLNSITLSETITTIGSYAFFGCSNLNNIAIPKSIAAIGTYAFSECSSLSSITIPGSVNTISDYAFADCSSLNSITILEGIASIGSNAFSGCSQLSSITIPNSITSIGGGAFRDCSNLISINIPDSVTSIGGNAFKNCSNLKNALIGNGVTNIGDYVFSNCSSLETVTTRSDIGFMMFENCKELSNITILDGVTSIDSGAFQACSSLVDINIPNSVTFLGSTFSGCSSLARVTIGDGIQSIADHTFYECSNLESLKLGKNITSIGQYAFYKCEKLSEVNIPNSVTRIDTCAFYGCKSLQNITIPGGVTTIEYQTFAQCENLTTLIIENGVTSIVGVAFPGCFELKCIVLPNSITSFEFGAFPFGSESKREIFYGGTKAEWSALANRPDANYVHYSSTNPEGHWNTVSEDATCSKSGYTVESCDCGYERNGVTTPAIGHTEVTDAAVEPTCTTNGLTEGKHCSVCNEVILAQEEIPGGHNVVNGVCTNCGAYGGKCGDNVTWILDKEGVLTLSGTGATYDYSGITNQVYAPWDGWREQISALVIGDNISGIGKELFYNLSALREVTIPAGVQSIGARAFAGCHNLTSITVSEENGKYKSVDGVLFSKDQTVLIAMPTGYSGNYAVPDGVIDIADGAFMYCMGVTDVAFPETLRSIGEAVFFNCHSLTTLQLPAGVSEIGARAFGNCAYLTAINIPESLTEISSGLFSESGVENIVLHEGITRIAGAAFWSSGLKAITIPGSVKKIENSAFSLCKNLETVVISEGVEIIDGTAFEECSALRNVVLPQSLKTIEGHAFRFCSSLTEVDIPAAVVSIGYNAFSGCSALSAITLHRGLQKIEYGTFEGTAVEKITIPATVTCIEWLAFADCDNLTEITFCGNAPFFDTHENEWNMFQNVTATAYYPINDSTWTSDVKQNYGGNITWVAYDPCGNGHSYGADHKCTICGIIGGICGENLTWVFDEGTGTLTISGTGDMYDHIKSTDMPWYNYRDQIVTIEVQSGVTSLGMYAFENCANMKQITLPDSLTSIGTSAFLKCTNLERIVIPNSVTEIPYGLFTECSKLEEVTLQNGITSIGEIAFANCSSLSRIDLPNSVTNIGVSAFVWCDSLKEIRFLGDAPVIEADSFAGITATAYYSAGNSTWTTSVMQNYGGTITWVPYCDNSHSFGEWITEGNNSSRTCIHCGYAEHKVVTDSGDVEIEVPEQPDLEVEVDPVLPSEDNYVLVEEVLDSTGNQNQTILKVFDINLKNNGINVQPSGTVKVKLPLDGDKDGKYKVYRVNDDGTLTDMNAYRQGNQMIFETDHFSLYVIVEETEHRHNYKPEVTAPTCTESGFTIYTCDCGDTYVGDEVAALDHNVVLQKSEAASCEVNGFEYYACERCGGKEYTIILESTGHDYENGTCSVCGEKDPDYVKPSKPGWGNMWDWIFGNWWGQGQKCDHEYTTVITAPTCTDKGYTTYTCSKCGDCYKDSYTNALGHTWDDGTVTEEASCTENGVRTYNCGTCEKQKEETIKAAGHDYVDGICSGCGAEENTKPSVPNKPTKPGFGFIFDWFFGGWWK